MKPRKKERLHCTVERSAPNGYNRLVLEAIFLVACAIVYFAAGSIAQQSTTFTLVNINTTGTGTSSSSAPGSYTVNGAGHGIGGVGDSFSFLRISTSGNVEMITKVNSQENTNALASAGLMIRESTESGAAHASVCLTPENGVNFFSRPNGAPQQTSVTLGASKAAPLWLKIVKSGNTISGFYSTDGYSDWTLVGSTTVELPELFLLGFAVSSNSDPSLSTVQFSNSVFMRDVPQRNEDLLLWLRADSGVSEEAGTIPLWEDQSGFGNNAAQPVLANQPKILANELNGLPVMDFAKVTTNRWMQVPPGFNDFTKGLSVFIVARSPSTVSDSRLIDFGRGTSNNNAQVYQSTNTGISFRAYNGGNGKAVVGSGMSTSEYKLAEVIHTGNFKATLLINGSEIATASGSSNMNNFLDIERTGNFIGKAFGSANYFEGRIAEIIIFKKELDTESRKKVESYFYYKYGLGTAPAPPPPMMSLASGVYSTAQNLTITGSTFVNEIRYTEDGSTPTPSSTIYTGPISISQTKTIKAIALSGGVPSDVSSVTIDIDPDADDVSRAGMSLWLKADAGVDIEGGGIRAWRDLSGANQDAVQQNSGNRPTLQPNAIGNMPAVQFNGTNQWLELPKGFPNGLSVFIVTKPTQSNSNRRFLDLSNQDEYNLQLFVQNSSTLRYRVFNPTQSTLDSSTLSMANHRLYEIIQNSSTANIFTDGGSPATSSTMNTIPAIARSSNFIGKAFGSSSYLEGQIAELIIYSRGVTTEERLGIEAYIHDKYGIGNKPTLPAPAIHPSTTTVSSPIPYPVRIFATNNAVIHYTIDNSTPTSASPVYPSSGLSLYETTTVKAIAVKPHFNNSPVSVSTIAVAPHSEGIVNDNLLVWLNAETIDGADQSAVSQWLDGSGKNNHALQANGANQPLLELNAQNGRPAVKFDGTNDWMQFPVGFDEFDLGISVFAVVKPTSTSPNSGRIIDWGNGNTNNNFQFFLQNNPNFRMSVLNGSNATNTTGNGVTNNAFQLLEAHHNGANIGALVVNGFYTGAHAGMHSITNITRTGNFLGKSYSNNNYLPGQIAELLVYNRQLSNENLALVRNYLFAKYALIQTLKPVITPSTGVFASPVEVRITSPTPGATIYYSNTGSSDPSTLYTGPFNISNSSTITAKAVLNESTSDLSTSYIQVDDNTKHLPRDSMLLWLKADNGLSSSVSLWPDVSGSNNHATQASSTKEPTLVNSAINGLPAVDFSGSDQWLEMPAGMEDFSKGLSLFIVAKPASDPPTNSRIMEFGTGSNSNYIRLSLPDNSSSQFWTHNSSNNSIIGTDSLSPSQYRLLEVSHTGKGAGAILSNAENKILALLQNPTVVTRTQNYLGRSNSGTPYFKGRIAEIILFNRKLTNDESRNVQAYLVGRYALGSNLVIPPTITPDSGVFGGNLEVSIAAFPDATIKFTTDGSTPDSGSQTYTEPFTVDESSLVKAVAIKDSNSSSVSSRYFKIDPLADMVTRSGLQVWLRSDSGIQKSGNSVSWWEDLSGKSTNAHQGDGQKTPFLVNVLGFPMIRTSYASVSDTRYLDVEPLSSDFSSGLTLMTVTRPLGGSGSDNPVFGVSNNATDNIDIASRPGNQRARGRVRQGSTSGSSITSSNNNSLALNRLSQVDFIQNGDSRGKIFINGTENNDSGLANPIDISRLTNYVGKGSDPSGDSYYTGDIAQILFYNRPLNSSEQVSTRSYLLTKYQLSLTADISAPVFSPTGGTAAKPLEVSINAPQGSTIYFTTDGTNPTTGSNIYQGPLKLEFTQTIKAIALYQGVLSSITTQTFTLDPAIWPAPNAANTTPLEFQLQESSSNPLQ